ncbi:MAG: J domain-containing protein [Myxococcota bacterium]
MWVSAIEHGIPLDPGEHELLVHGLLHQVCAPKVEAVRIDALAGIAGRLGVDLDVVVGDALRMSVTRLRAFGELGLPLDASPRRIKDTHRRLVKRFHPDRYATDPVQAESANKVLTRLNGARAQLTAPYEPLAPIGEDDLSLDEPWFETEDAPTQDYDELSVDETIERG